MGAPGVQAAVSAVLGPRVIAVGGGKGGVGKTFLTANLSVALACAGQRVVAVDSDLEGANLHTCLGMPAPRVGLADFVARREEELAKLVVGTPVANLELIAGTHSNLAVAQPSHERRIRLMRGLRGLRVDYVLIDLGAGIHSATLDYFLLADDGLLVLTPEPTSVENAYCFLRAAFYRRLHLAAIGHGVSELVDSAMDQRNQRGIRTPLDLLREIAAIDPVEGARFSATMRGFRPRIVVNNARNTDDIELGFQIRSVCRKYFGVDTDYLGYVNHDEAVRRSIAARRPLVDFRPGSEASLFLRRIARKLTESHGHIAPRTGERPAARPLGYGGQPA